MNISELLQQQHYLLNTLYDAPMQFNQQVDQAKQRLDQQVNQAKQRLEQWLKEIEKEQLDSKREATDVYHKVKEAIFEKFKDNHHYLDEAKKYLEKVEGEYIAMQRKPDLTVNENSIRSQMQDLGKVLASSINESEESFSLLIILGVVFVFLPCVCLAVDSINRNHTVEPVFCIIPIAMMAIAPVVKTLMKNKERNIINDHLRQLADLYCQWLELADHRPEMHRANAQQAYQQMVDAAQRQYNEVMQRVQSILPGHLSPADRFAPPWQSDVWQHWQPGTLKPGVLRVGTFALASIPALFSFPTGRSLVFKGFGNGDGYAIAGIQSLLLRLLASVPPGKLRFTFIDPVGMGNHVTPFLHLKDYDKQLITSQAWSEPSHIEQRLADLTEHIGNVIQQYLRNQYATIEDYNAHAGEIAEPYHVLVVFDFPVNFSETAARRLVSIVQHGPRCGVYTVIQIAPNKSLPYGFNLNDLTQHTEVIRFLNNEHWWGWSDGTKEYWLTLDAPPDAALVNRIVAGVGKAAEAASKVEVPFDRIAPKEYWKGNSSDGICVFLGPSGARTFQELALGDGTKQHVLVAGRTGSGKSTLLHTLIINLALTYSPDEVEVYLVDFKEGVEFKIYANYQLPHARVVAIESEREFGLSVLEGLEAELGDRGKRFREAGAANLAQYRAKTNQKLPRILLLVDEFQIFFTEDDSIASKAGRILDLLVRQGRSFGIHVLLGSQTLAGAYTLARSTMDQMAVRIALQCSEADSRLILADDNPAARLLSRPGEAIYNDANGRVEGNSRFQTAWLPEDQRNVYLAQIAELAKQNGYRTPRPQIVFEGNAPAEVEKNDRLRNLLTAPAWPASTPREQFAWLGDPTAIRDPIAAVFCRQSGSNLLIVGQDEEAALGMMAIALISLAAQLPVGGKAEGEDGATFYVLDFSKVNTSYAGLWHTLADILPHTVKVGRRIQLPGLIAELAADVQARLNNERPDELPRYLVLFGLQQARDLDQEELGYSSYGEDSAQPNPTRQFATIVREGPDLGIHTLVWCDTKASLERRLDRRTLREFTMRVALQMSEEDSSSLLNSPLASRLGPYRALFYSEVENRMEKFRPYRLPSAMWLEQVRQWFKARS
jgi:energy-coupling factor transporter ATP-binding protein EcfA2/vacuolar-type H+-ATPase subunit H